MNLQARFPNERLSLILDVSDALVLLDTMTLGATGRAAMDADIETDHALQCATTLAVLASRNTYELVPDAMLRQTRLRFALLDWLKARPRA